MILFIIYLFSKALTHYMETKIIICICIWSVVTLIKVRIKTAKNEWMNDYFEYFISWVYITPDSYLPASGEFRNFARLTVFSGCLRLSVMAIFGLIRALRCKLWITSYPSFFVLNGIFLGFCKEEFFLNNFTYFFPKILIRGWAINYSLTITAIEHIFGKRIS